MNSDFYHPGPQDSYHDDDYALSSLKSLTKSEIVRQTQFRPELRNMMAHSSAHVSNPYISETKKSHRFSPLLSTQAPPSSLSPSYTERRRRAFSALKPNHIDHTVDIPFVPEIHPVTRDSMNPKFDLSPSQSDSVSRAAARLRRGRSNFGPGLSLSTVSPSPVLATPPHTMSRQEEGMMQPSRGASSPKRRYHGIRQVTRSPKMTRKPRTPVTRPSTQIHGSPKRMRSVKRTNSPSLVKKSCRAVTASPASPLARRLGQKTAELLAHHPRPVFFAVTSPHIPHGYSQPPGLRTVLSDHAEGHPAQSIPLATAGAMGAVTIDHVTPPSSPTAARSPGYSHLLSLDPQVSLSQPGVSPGDPKEQQSGLSHVNKKTPATLPPAQATLPPAPATLPPAPAVPSTKSNTGRSVMPVPPPSAPSGPKSMESGSEKDTSFINVGSSSFVLALKQSRQRLKHSPNPYEPTVPDRVGMNVGRVREVKDEALTEPSVSESGSENSSSRIAALRQLLSGGRPLK
eukprot:gnl/Dysnectes_brevis/5197_a7370_394.p1 GENE.gnl/Dysnectes_brevis/5197_a7370_394~~gnl/Dysnectes_brevis/5197_a7370_394.p1  ORF type:complete len:513 (+),score=24.55 gnl/Dysnectes_brevis/5197_a7370_394:100-1638(+)